MQSDRNKPIWGEEPGAGGEDVRLWQIKIWTAAKTY